MMEKLNNIQFVINELIESIKKDKKVDNENEKIPVKKYPI